MNEQPEALRLADELAIQHQYDFYKVCEEAAAELRRLHEENERLRKTAMLTLCTLSCTYEIKHAVKAEREACALACEAEGERFKHHPSGRRDFSICAAAIRARGEQEQPR